MICFWLQWYRIWRGSSYEGQWFQDRKSGKGQLPCLASQSSFRLSARKDDRTRAAPNNHEERFRQKRQRSPCPTYKHKGPFSSAKDILIPQCPYGIPRMNFPEFPGSAFLLAFLSSLLGNPELSEFSGIFLERVLGVPKPRFREKMK